MEHKAKQRPELLRMILNLGGSEASFSDLKTHKTKSVSPHFDNTITVVEDQKYLFGIDCAVFNEFGLDNNVRSVISRLTHNELSVDTYMLP
jgi:hypothetical protein